MNLMKSYTYICWPFIPSETYALRILFSGLRVLSKNTRISYTWITEKGYSDKFLGRV